VQEKEALQAADLAAARERIAALEAAMQPLVDMCLVHGDFRNGVTDSSGTMDEGEVKAGEIIRRAARILTQGRRDTERGL
jgi:hypothetical protein